LNGFERIKESEIRLRYELDIAREEAAAYQREAEEAKQQLLLLQRLPSIQSSTRSVHSIDDDGYDFMEVPPQSSKDH